MSFENPKEFNYSPVKEIAEIQKRVTKVEAMEADVASFETIKDAATLENRNDVSTIMTSYSAEESKIYSTLDSSINSLELMVQSKLTDPNVAPDSGGTSGGTVVLDTKLITDKPLSDIYIDAAENKVIAGTKSKGIAIGTLNFTTDFTFKNSEYGISSVISVLMKLSNTYLLIGTNNGLIFYNLTDGTFTIKKTSDGLPSNTITALYITDEGYILVGTDNGIAISKSTGASFGSYDIYQTLQGITINCIEVYKYTSSAYRMIVGTPSGIYFKDMSVDTNTIFIATAINAQFTSKYVNDVKYDAARDAMYIATDTGLLIIKNYLTSPTYIMKDGYDGLSSSVCYSIVFDTTGLYVGTNAGISYTSDYGDTFKIYSKSSGVSNYTCIKLKIQAVNASGEITNLTILHAIGLTYNFAIPTT
jgi:ligand-binding sensor domain-containing protein